MDDRWFGNAFQIFEATDESIWRLPCWFYVGKHISTKMKKSEVLTQVYIVGWVMQDRMAAKIAAVWK